MLDSRAPPTGPKPRYSPILAETWTVCYIALAIFGVFVLAALPRIIARLLSGRSGELDLGWRLGNRGKRDSPIKQYAVGLHHAPSGTAIPPKHLSAWTMIVPGSTRLSSPVPFFNGLTFGQLLILLAYTALIGVAVGIKSPVEEPKHAGQIAVFQLPLAVLLAIPMSPLSKLLGLDYRRLQFLHRAVGRLIFVASTIHAAVFTHKFMQGGSFAETARKPKFIGGYAAWAALTLMLLTALPFVRRRMFGLFRICHFVGFSIAVIGLGFHTPRTLLIGLIAAGIYGLDILLRSLKLRMRTGYLTRLPACSSTQITVPTITSGWRAGQHVYIRVPGMSKLGGMGWWENHPFTIASASGGQLVLVAKKAGDWTRGLYDFAGEVELSEKGPSGSKRCRIVLEGPYGGPGSTLPASYSSLVLLAGGGGITYALGVLEDIVHKVAEGAACTTSISLIWVVKDHDECRPFVEHLGALLQICEASGFHADIQIYCTRSSKGSSLGEGGITIYNDRPNLAIGVEGAVTRSRQLGEDLGESAKGVFVGTCGPESLISDVQKAVLGLSSELRRAVGGVHFHAERFQ